MGSTRGLRGYVPYTTTHLFLRLAPSFAQHSERSIDCDAYTIQRDSDKTVL